MRRFFRRRSESRSNIVDNSAFEPNGKPTPPERPSGPTGLDNTYEEPVSGNQGGAYEEIDYYSAVVGTRGGENEALMGAALDIRKLLKFYKNKQEFSLAHNGELENIKERLEGFEDLSYEQILDGIKGAGAGWPSYKEDVREAAIASVIFAIFSIKKDQDFDYEKLVDDKFLQASKARKAAAKLVLGGFKSVIFEQDVYEDVDRTFSGGSQSSGGSQGLPEDWQPVYEAGNGGPDLAPHQVAAQDKEAKREGSGGSRGRASPVLSDDMTPAQRVRARQEAAEEAAKQRIRDANAKKAEEDAAKAARVRPRSGGKRGGGPPPRRSPSNSPRDLRASRTLSGEHVLDSVHI